MAAPDDAWSATSARAALVEADLLVGLHCDGAAEPIIDFALAHGKAFAIVPRLPAFLCGGTGRSFVDARVVRLRASESFLTFGRAGAVRAASSSLIGG